MSQQLQPQSLAIMGEGCNVIDEGIRTPTGESLLSRAADQGSRLFTCEFARRPAPWLWPLS
jgi:hypothetical protein